MARSAQELLVVIDASTEALRRELKKADTQVNKSTSHIDRSLHRVNRSFEKMGAAVSRATSALGALGIAVGGAELVRFASKSLDTAETVQRMALALGTTTDTVQELGFTFRQFRLDSDDVSDALNTIADRARDAVDGTQSMVDDFALLGVSVDELRGKRPVELFELMARHVASIQDPTARAAAVVRTFGDDLGRKLLPLLIQGEQGLDKFRQQAHEVGAVLSEETVDGASQAAKEFRKIREQVNANFTRVVADNAEELRGLAESLSELTEVAIKAAAAFADMDIAALSSTLGKRLLENSGPAFLFRQLGGKEKMDKAALDFLGVNNPQKRGPIQIEPIGVTGTPINPSGGTSTSDFTPLEDTLAKIEQARFEKFMDVPKENTEKLGEELDKAAQKTEEMQRLGDSLGFAFESSFEQAIMSAQSFGDVLQGLAEDIERILLRQFITKPIANALGAGISRAFGGGQVAQSADGNVFTGPSMTTIAERGMPEAVLPLTRIGGQLGVKSAGGSGVTVNVINKGQPMQVESQRQRRGSDGRQVVDVMVAESFRRQLGQGEFDSDFATNLGVRRPGRF